MDQTVAPASATEFVVDDDDAVRRALQFLLEMEGFAVETFASGEALLLRAPPVGPGCMLIDERLPGVSGLDTLRQLRARRIELPAILITSHPKPGLREAAARDGTPILEKPLPAEALVTAINKAMANAG